MSATLRAQIVERLAHEIGQAVLALTGRTGAPTLQATAAVPVTYVVRTLATGALEGPLLVGLAEADGRQLASVLLGQAAPTDEAVLDAWREVCGQAIGAFESRSAGQAVRLAIAGAERIDARHFEPCDAVACDLGDGLVLPLMLEGVLQAGAVLDPVVPSVQGAVETRGSRVPTHNLDVLLDVELPLAVRFGQTELPLQTLVRLCPGSVIDLHRTADEPVDVLVSGKVIARGEVVVVDGNYGVRVTQIVSTAERLRSMGA